MKFNTQVSLSLNAIWKEVNLADKLNLLFSSKGYAFNTKDTHSSVLEKLSLNALAF